MFLVVSGVKVHDLYVKNILRRNEGVIKPENHDFDWGEEVKPKTYLRRAQVVAQTWPYTGFFIPYLKRPWEFIGELSGSGE